MDTLQLPKQREKVVAAADKEEEERPTTTTTTTSTSPPSSSSSPSHEFSFTFSLHPSSTTPPDHKTAKSQPPPSFAIDLSPADDIFFHGQLLPLHLLSHVPVSPRSSTNSFDSFNLPSKDTLEDSKPNSNSSSNSTKSSGGTKGRNKLKLIKSLSLFGLTKWQKGCERDAEAEANDADIDEEKKKKKKKKRKIRFDVGHILKRYVRMVRPLLVFSKGRKENCQFLRQQPHSFSGNLSWGGRGRRGRGGGGQFSAPASIATSPSNSGLLVATDFLPSQTSSDSTMEELHNAIQAAIAHCKNSIAMKEEKLKC